MLFEDLGRTIGDGRLRRFRAVGNRLLSSVEVAIRFFAITFLFLAAAPKVVWSQVPVHVAAVSQGALTRPQIVERLADLGHGNDAVITNYLASVPFEDVYQIISIDTLLQLLLDGGIFIPSIQNVEQARAALRQKVDYQTSQLRSDGVLQALASPLNGSRLIFPEETHNAVVQARQYLEALWVGDQANFLRRLTNDEFLRVLGATVPLRTSALRPIRAVVKFARNTQLDELQYVYEAVNVSDLMVDSAVTESAILESIANPTSIAKMASALQAVPAGYRTLYVGGSFLYNLPDGHGGMLPTQNDPLYTTNGLPVTQPGNGKILYGPWMDNWEASVKRRVETLLTALIAAGGSFDYVMLDYEEKNAAHYEMNTQCTNVANCILWQAVVADPRWPALRSDLGFTDNDILGNLRNNLWGSTSGDPTLNATRWNIYQERKRNQHISRAVYAPILSRFPNVKFGSFGDGLQSALHVHQNWGRFTNTMDGLGGIDHPDVRNALSSESLRSAGEVDTPSGTIAPPTNAFEMLQHLAVALRASASTSRLGSLHWITGADYYLTNNNRDVSILPLYPELFFHAALMGQEYFYLQTSSWSTLQGHKYVNWILQELNDPLLFGSNEPREPITVEKVDFGDEFLVSGMRIGARNVYRVSWADGAPSSIVHRIPGGLEFRKGTKVFQIAGGRILPAVPVNSINGVWVVVDDPTSGKLLRGDLENVNATLQSHTVPNSVMAKIRELSFLAAPGYEVDVYPGNENTFAVTLRPIAGFPIPQGGLANLTYTIDTSLNVIPRVAYFTNSVRAGTDLHLLLDAVSAVKELGGDPLARLSLLSLRKVSKKGKVSFVINGRKGEVSRDKRGRLKMKIAKVKKPKRHR